MHTLRRIAVPAMHPPPLSRDDIYQHDGEREILCNQPRQNKINQSEAIMGDVSIKKINPSAIGI